MSDEEKVELPAADRDAIHGELEQVRATSTDGLLHPESVVEWAKANPASAIHGKIEWDDLKAATAHRVAQVRGLIRAIVVSVGSGVAPIRAYVSKPSDRVSGGGYSPTDEAMSRARNELVNEALRKLERFGNSFTHLPELAGLFIEINAAVLKYRQSLVKSAA